MARYGHVAGITCQVQGLESRCLLSQTVITGVLPVALDQPQIHALLRRDLLSDPLQASDGMGGTLFDITAFFDSGTSGILLSQETADALGVAREVSGGVPVTYYDVGIGGLEPFDVSEPLYVSLAPFGTEIDVGNLEVWPSVYTQTAGPVRTQIAQLPADELLGPLDILGMPLFASKVVVMDATPLNELSNMKTYVYSPGTPYRPATLDSDPGIVPVSSHVKLSFGSFGRFSLLDPATAAGPSTQANPFIGPDPVRRLDDPTFNDGTPPVTIGLGTHTTTGSFLVDTGSAASFISQAKAAEVGVHYQAGTYGSDDPILLDSFGNPMPNQFALTVGGIGGSLNVAGFFLDRMVLQTIEGDQIVFDGAPVLVVDVTVEDPYTGQTLTLDGDFGMNYLVASAMVVGGWPTDIHAGGFDWITIDQPSGVMGLELTDYGVSAPVITGISPDTGISATDGITSSRTPTVAGIADPDMLVTVYRDGVALGFTVSDSTGAWTFSTTGTSLANGQYSFTADASDMIGGVSDSSLPYIVTIDGTAPAVPSLSINDGATQRSMVKKLTLTFSEKVSLSGTAVSLKLRDGTTPANVTATLSNPSGDQRTYTLTFSGTGTVGGSIPDGIYDISVSAAGVQDLAGNLMAGSYTQRFHRLFGDSDGNKVVNALDYAKLRNTLGRASTDPLFNSSFDYEANNLINALDLARFRQRYGLSFSY